MKTLDLASNGPNQTEDYAPTVDKPPGQFVNDQKTPGVCSKFDRWSRMLVSDVKLVEPTVDLHQSWMDNWKEWGTLDQNGAATYVARLFDLDLTVPTDFGKFVDLLKTFSDPSFPRPVGFVASTTRWLVYEDEYLGSIQLRHSIDTKLLTEISGHIGYGIRPSVRGRGLARKALSDMRVIAKELGLEQVLLTCPEDNIASAKVIEACGGKLERVREVDDFSRSYGYLTPMRRYWIDLLN